MLISKLKVFKSHGKQYIPNLLDVTLAERFRGRPVISPNVDEKTVEELVQLCPVEAISKAPLSLDLGKCVFCGECQFQYPQAINFTNDYRIATCRREDLIVTSDIKKAIPFDPQFVNSYITKYFGRSLKLRQVCAGGDNSSEMELNASMNVNFDFSRYGIEFVASPRHADGVVITGPITKSMEAPLQMCFEAIADPKIIIVVGADAISGGVFANSSAISRDFFNLNKPNLWIPGNPMHPMTFIDGVLSLIGRAKRNENE